MKSFYTLQHPCCFQGEQAMKQKRNYFEGWYFKNTNSNYTISFIPGIQVEGNEKSAFIQIITNQASHYISYPYEAFSFQQKPFAFHIDQNYFSFDQINLSIEDNGIELHGSLTYHSLEKIKHNMVSPNIMGPFSYLPFMECNHAIVSMKHSLKGSLEYNKKLYSFHNGIGYIEKDWGHSFPSSYVWMQANQFSNPQASFFLSIANIPMKTFSFTGFICVLKLDHREYRFATYNGSKIIKYDVQKQITYITLQHRSFILEITSHHHNSNTLLAPQNGKMKNHINESIDSEITVKLLKHNTLIFQDKSENCGLELV